MLRLTAPLVSRWVIYMFFIPPSLTPVSKFIVTIMQCFGALLHRFCRWSLNFFPPTCLSISCPLPKCYNTLPLVTVLKTMIGRGGIGHNKTREWQWYVSVYWSTEPPITFRYLRPFSNLHVPSFLLFKGFICNTFNLYLSFLYFSKGQKAERVFER